MDTVSCALLPSDCALCGSPLPRLSSAPICDACWAEFPVLKQSVCTRCGDILAGSDAAGLVTICRSCRLAPPPFVRAVSYGRYEGRMRDAIHAFKYQRLHSLARRLGGMLASAIGQLADEAPAEMLVVPVPLHRSKYAQRGFNQARLLASHALAALRRTHPEWRLTLAASTIVRQRVTHSQAGLTPRERRKNVRGAFVVPNPKAITRKHILVIDDILTTGATARSVAQALLRAGAENVWVATLARAHRIYGARGRGGVYTESVSQEESAGVRTEARRQNELESARLHSPRQPSF